MLAIIPYRVDVPQERFPIANYLIIASCIIMFFVSWSNPKQLLEPFVLNSFSITKMIGSCWLHADLLHLLGNMIFLLVFGNAVCAKLGNIIYPIIYIAICIIAGTVYMLIDGSPVIGASGVINGIVGMYVVWFALNEISCFVWVLFILKSISVDSFWVIIVFVCFDLYGIISDGQGIAYMAHLTGFITGFGIAVFLLKSGHVTMTRYESSLLDILGIPIEHRQSSSDEISTNDTQPDKKPLFGKKKKSKVDQIVIYCQCGKKLRFELEHAGKMTKCPDCSSLIRIPNAVEL